MITDKILSRKPIPLAKAREIVKERTKESEPTYEQDLTLKYCEKFSHLTAKKSEKVLEDLKKLESIDEELRVKIADTLPEEKEVMDLLAAKSKAKPEDLAKALEISKKYKK